MLGLSFNEDNFLRSIRQEYFKKQETFVRITFLKMKEQSIKQGGIAVRAVSKTGLKCHW